MPLFWEFPVVVVQNSLKNFRLLRRETYQNMKLTKWSGATTTSENSQNRGIKKSPIQKS